MATQFKTPEEAKARYDEIAKGLLAGDVGGTKFGHDQIMWDGSKFVDNDLVYKKGDPSKLKAHGANVASTLNNVVSEYGLDTSGFKPGQYVGAVYNNVGGHGTVDAKTAFDRIFSSNFKDQFDKKLATYTPPAPSPESAPAPVAPPPPLQYGQPPAPPPPAPPGPVDPSQLHAPFAPAPQGLGSLAPPPPAVPTHGTAPGARPDGAPGFQQMPTAVNNLPRGPAIGGQYAQATSAGDPFMQYRAPQYSQPLTGDQAYQQQGLDILSRYGMTGGEHNFLPNRSTFEAVDAAKRYGAGSTLPTTTPQTEAEKAAAAVYARMRT